MKDNFKYLTKDKLLKRLFIISLILIILTVVLIVISFTKLPPLLPLYNQLPWGDKRLTSTLGIFIPPIIVFAIFLADVVLSVYSYPKSPLIARMFSITSFLVSMLTFLFILRTILLII